MSQEPAVADKKPEAPLPPPRRRRWRSLLIGAILLLCGTVIGAAATLAVARNRLMQILHHPERMPTAASQRLKRRLDLTDEQTARVEQILRERQSALMQIRREAQPRVEAELERIRGEVEAVLNEAQAKQWNADYERLRRNWLPPRLPEPGDGGK